MPTPTGTISLSDVNVELGLSSTAAISMNDAAVRSLAGVGGSGTIITMDNLRGKSNISATLSSYNAGNGYDINLERSIFAGYGSVYAQVGVTLYANGSARYFYQDYYTATTNFTSFTWKTGGGSSGDYSAIFERNPWSSTPVYSTPADSWFPISQTREWMASAEAITNSEVWHEVFGTLKIRNAAGTVLASKSIYMYASAISGTPL